MVELIHLRRSRMPTPYDIEVSDDFNNYPIIEVSQLIEDHFLNIKFDELHNYAIEKKFRIISSLDLSRRNAFTCPCQGYVWFAKGKNGLAEVVATRYDGSD